MKSIGCIKIGDLLSFNMYVVDNSCGENFNTILTPPKECQFPFASDGTPCTLRKNTFRECPKECMFYRSYVPCILNTDRRINNCSQYNRGGLKEATANIDEEDITFPGKECSFPLTSDSFPCILKKPIRKCLRRTCDTISSATASDPCIMYFTPASDMCPRG